MKVKVEESGVFAPVTVTIEITSERELLNLWARTQACKEVFNRGQYTHTSKVDHTDKPLWDALDTLCDNRNIKRY